MIKLDLKFPLLNLDGEELKDERNQSVLASKVFASLLMAQKSGDAVKYFDWATTLHKTGVVEVDAADFTAIKTLVKDNTDHLMMISKAQLIKYFDTVKIK